MANFLDLLFGPPRLTGKDKLTNHPNHRSCDFGIKYFNKTKRDQGFVQEIKLQESNRRVKPPKDQPPAPPPSGTLETAVILLDFDGALITGTSWNFSGDINAAHSGLTQIEQETVLAAVRADYLNFNALSERVMFTTDQAIYDAAPASRRGRCVITESWEWYGQSGGVAFVNGFGNIQQNTCFVFSSLLGYNLKYIMEAVSHEVAHMFGCYHQSLWENGVKINEYNYGADGIAPIPGCANYQPEGKWWIGLNSYGNTQDDAAVIGTKLG